jgi:hypothetical protein
MNEKRFVEKMEERKKLNENISVKENRQIEKSQRFLSNQVEYECIFSYKDKDAYVFYMLDGSYGINLEDIEAIKKYFKPQDIVFASFIDEDEFPLMMIRIVWE